MRFFQIRSLSGELEWGQPKEWGWWKDGGGYFMNRDFFVMHWEVHFEDANCVRLHVESPCHKDDEMLNGIKGEVVKGLLSSNLEHEIKLRDFGYRAGRQTPVSNIQRNKCTEAFRVILRSEQQLETHRENIKKVHSAIGPTVHKVLLPFIPRLNTHFND